MTPILRLHHHSEETAKSLLSNTLNYSTEHICTNYHKLHRYTTKYLPIMHHAKCDVKNVQEREEDFHDTRQGYSYLSVSLGDRVLGGGSRGIPSQIVLLFT